MWASLFWPHKISSIVSCVIQMIVVKFWKYLVTSHCQTCFGRSAKFTLKFVSFWKFHQNFVYRDDFHWFSGVSDTDETKTIQKAEYIRRLRNAFRRHARWRVNNITVFPSTNLVPFCKTASLLSHFVTIFVSFDCNNSAAAAFYMNQQNKTKKGGSLSD